MRQERPDGSRGAAFRRRKGALLKLCVKVPLVLREREFVAAFFALDSGDDADKLRIDAVVSVMFAEFERSALALVGDAELAVPDLIAAYAAAAPREAEAGCGFCVRSFANAANAAAAKFQESVRQLAFKMAAAPVKRNAKKPTFAAVEFLACVLARLL
jgi:hypothetical protein